MPEVPDDLVSKADIAVWYQMQDQLRQLKFKEAQLRRRIIKTFFPNGEEGANTYLLDDGYKLKGTIVVSRDIEQASLDANRKRLEKEKIPVDRLVRYLPDLVLKEYRKLTEDHRTLFDECLIIKEGSPQLRIDPPSNK